MTRTLRLTLAYDGTAYHGWQVQPVVLTVQGLLTDALTRILREPVKVVGASRTDAGVHALGQVASFVTTRQLSLPAIRSGLNALLPPDVRVLEVAEAPPGFDARRWARLKRYAYLIDNGPVARPLLRRYAWHVPRPLEASFMRAGLGALRGKHDFSAFCAAPGRERTPVCTVFAARLVSRRTLLAVFVSADSFLHHMVRNIVGSLVEVGAGRRPPAWIRDLLLGRDRTRSGPTAPAQGLTLLRVGYPVTGASSPLPE
ncbi:MAG: tRNA pseudouridine(38-40) synthase TruA [Candidatus Rokubacteria bacterium]|nr:tRNA pseudouridine(38-40) synthase TruA [Candidatus Rokubacteria bacterium]